MRITVQAALKALQAVVLAHRTAQFARAARRCRSCGQQLACEDTKFLIYRTAFGCRRGCTAMKVAAVVVALSKCD